MNKTLKTAESQALFRRVLPICLSTGTIHSMETLSGVAPSQVSRSVQALKAWHQLNIEDIAAAMNVSRATAERRLKDGEYRYEEVRALAAYFGVSVEALETGAVDLPGSVVAVNFTSRRPATHRKRPRMDSNHRPTTYKSHDSRRDAPKLTAKAA